MKHITKTGRILLTAAVIALACSSFGHAGISLFKRHKLVLPAGWVVIHSKGKHFRMGQQFPGRRWTYTFPVHDVAFTYNFAMDLRQVTQAEYLAVAGVNPTLHPGDLQRPIDNVSWFDAVLYCNALSKKAGLDAVYSFGEIKRGPDGRVTELTDLRYDIKKKGYRLPTSAEYEFVTRAGTTTTYFWSDAKEDQDISKKYAWSELNSGGTTHPVGTLAPNTLGIYDITGNLWMWCSDWYGGDDQQDPRGAYPSEPQIDQIGPVEGTQRIARGGAFKNDVEGHERSAYHWQWPPAAHNYEVGFRVVRTIS